MQHVSELAEHTNHLLRFSFIASIRVERPSAGNDQKKDGRATLRGSSVCLLLRDSRRIRLVYCQVMVVTCGGK